jgi:hypothetical protein
MSEKLSLGGGYTNVEDAGAAFEGIVQAGLDPNYVAEAAPVEPTIPFGQFTQGEQVDERRAPMATSTGYTGNNAEESA